MWSITNLKASKDWSTIPENSLSWSPERSSARWLLHHCKLSHSCTTALSIEVLLSMQSHWPMLILLFVYHYFFSAFYINHISRRRVIRSVSLSVSHCSSLSTAKRAWLSWSRMSAYWRVCLSSIRLFLLRCHHPNFLSSLPPSYNTTSSSSQPPLLTRPSYSATLDGGKYSRPPIIHCHGGRCTPADFTLL